LLSIAHPLITHAATLLETAPLGTTNGGTSISDMQYLGARFTLDGTYRIAEIGGHVKSSSTYEDRSIFVAIVPTNNPDNLPADITLSDAIYATNVEAPFNDLGPYPYQVDETIISTNFILDPGNYAIVFGSGLFGATGSGWMPVSGSVQSTPWLIQGKWAGDYFRQIDDQPVRFVVSGVAVPIPPALYLFGSGLLGLIGISRKKAA
jgi:hypothetical protein